MVISAGNRFKMAAECRACSSALRFVFHCSISVYRNKQQQRQEEEGEEEEGEEEEEEYHIVSCARAAAS